jgi:hypothetical protein
MKGEKVKQWMRIKRKIALTAEARKRIMEALIGWTYLQPAQTICRRW